VSFIPPISGAPQSPGQFAMFHPVQFKKTIPQMQYASIGSGRGVVEITPESLKALEDCAAWCTNVARNKLPWADHMLAKTMAMVAGGMAQKRSAGIKRAPQDTTRSWKMPVPRVTSKYFMGWRIKRVSNEAYLLTNDSREAYFIEFGIHRNPRTGQPSPRRIRRPVLKLSVLEMLKMIYASPIGHRVWSSILIPKPGEPGARTNLVKWSQPSGVMGTQNPFIVTRLGLFEVLSDYPPTVMK